MSVPLCFFSATSLRKFFSLHFITETSAHDGFMNLRLSLFSDLTIGKLKASVFCFYINSPCSGDGGCFVDLKRISDNVLIAQIYYVKKLTLTVNCISDVLLF